jgi:hypothetical protein
MEQIATHNQKVESARPQRQCRQRAGAMDPVLTCVGRRCAPSRRKPQELDLFVYQEEVRILKVTAAKTLTLNCGYLLWRAGPRFAGRSRHLFATLERRAVILGYPPSLHEPKGCAPKGRHGGSQESDRMNVYIPLLYLRVFLSEYPNVADSAVSRESWRPTGVIARPRCN